MKQKFMPILAGVLMMAMAVPAAAQACTGQKNNQQLTPQQRSQMEQLKRNTEQELNAILTPAQQQQFQNAKASGQGMRAALASLNLSPQQETQVQQLMESKKQQKQAIMNSN
jgi:ribonuclease HII